MMDRERQGQGGPNGFTQTLIDYASAWEHVRELTQGPSIDSFLQQVAVSDRPALRVALESIADRFRQQLLTRPTCGAPPSLSETLGPETLGRETLEPETLEPDAKSHDTSLPGETDVTVSIPTGSSPQTPNAAGPGTSVRDTLEGNPHEIPTASDRSAATSFPGQDAAPDSRGPNRSSPTLAMGGKGLAQIEGYEILGELGRGGMGVVLKARERNTQRVVCIKMMLAGEFASPEALRRFQVETEAAANLDHPNIVPIYRAGESGGIPYFVMKYVDGKPLDQAQQEKIGGDPRSAASLMVKICRAVHFAHARGILHRDIKPANILLDSDREPHITDFGLAKKIGDDSGQTRTGTIMGTPDYMSPEQAVGRNDLVTVTSDVYSLGSVLFDLLTGQPPFKSATIVETLTRVTKEPARTPTSFNRRVGQDLETICLKCLEKDPAKRYGSAAALADELERYLRGEPILGRPVGNAQRTWRWCRRNPVVSTLGAALLLVLVAVAIGSSIAAYQINQQRNVAITAQEESETARRLAMENASIADQQRTLALDTLHNLVTSVESKLHDRPDLADLQTEILQDALKGLQEVSRTAETSGRADRTIGVAHQRIADILDKIGRTQEAIQQHDHALAIFQRLMQTDPHDDWARWNAAISYDKLGDYQLGTDAEKAAALYRHSTSLRNQLALSVHSKDLLPSARRYALAISASKIGQLQMIQGQPAEARDYFEQARIQSEAMLRENPDNLQGKMALAGSCELLGNVTFRLRQHEAAHGYYRQALAMRQELHEQDRQNISATKQLAKSYDVFGDFELQTGRTPAAQEYYQKAALLLDGLSKADANDVKIKAALSTAHYKLATVLLRLGRPDEAQPVFHKCLLLREELAALDAANPDSQIALMLAQARCGQHEKASELADQLAREAAENAGTLFCVAGGFALCLDAVDRDSSGTHPPGDNARRKKQYEESAINALRKAIDLGFRDIVSLETDPDLDPLRNLPGFQQLLAEVEPEAR